MRSDPESRMHWEWKYYEKVGPPPPPPEKPKASPPKRMPRVPAAKPPLLPTYSTAEREKVFKKYALTTEALTAEERKIIHGYRISRRDLGMED